MIDTLKLRNSFQSLAMQTNANVGYTEVGIIIAYDPTNRLVIVELSTAVGDQPGSKTGWIPLTTPWGGPGWGMFAAPTPGTACLVHYQNANKQSGYAALISFGGSTRPVPVDSGEFWLVHQSGSVLKFTNDGNVEISANVALNLNAQSEINITAPTVNISADSECNITSPLTKIGNTGGDYLPVFKSDSSPTTNLQAS